MTTEVRLPSLEELVDRKNPFDSGRSTSLTIKRLKQEKHESRYLEWKQSYPLGKDAPKTEKYRFVKAAISFANTSGGFIVIGVSNSGEWIGIPENKFIPADSSHFDEVFSNCVTPELNFLIHKYTFRKKNFIIIFIPKSLYMPHITISNITDGTANKKRALITKNMVYCRRGATSDIATPSDYQRIIQNRIEYVRSELLKRIEHVTVEVPILTPKPLAQSKTEKQIITVSSSTQNTKIEKFRRANPDEESNIHLVHETVSPEFFSDINNITEILTMMSNGSSKSLYYKIYSKREEINSSNYANLANAGFNKFYAPYLFWFSQLSTENICEIIKTKLQEIHERSKHVYIRHFIKFIFLFENMDLINWLDEVLKNAWGKMLQKPDYYWNFVNYKKYYQTKDYRLLVINKTNTSTFTLNNKTYTYRELLSNNKQACELLSQACLISNENTSLPTGLCRDLDIIAYGHVLKPREKEFANLCLQL